MQELSLADGVSYERMASRQTLLADIDRQRAALAIDDAGGFKQRAFSLLASPESRQAFDLAQEPDSVRDRYGRNIHGQCVLLARRLVEHGVPLVSVNWHNVFVPSLGIAEMVVRGTLMYLALFAILRFIGRRQAGHFGPADLLVIRTGSRSERPPQAGVFVSALPAPCRRQDLPPFTEKAVDSGFPPASATKSPQPLPGMVDRH